MIYWAGSPLAQFLLLVLLALLLLAVTLVWRRTRGPARPARHRKASADDVEFEANLQRGLRHQGYLVESAHGDFLAIRRGGETSLVSYIGRRRTGRTRTRIVRLERAMALQGAAAGKFVTEFSLSKRIQKTLSAKSIDWIGPRELSDLLVTITARDIARDRDWVTSYKPQPVTVAPVLESEPAAVVQSPRCPRCDSGMQLQTASTGAASGAQYWRCDRAPACKGMRPA